MFVTLLLVTFMIALIVSAVVARLFNRPIDAILKRIVADEISAAWLKYLHFAIFVVGISSGVRVYELERYITPQRWDKDSKIIELVSDRWILEVYRTVIGTLQGIAWMLLVFFVVALIAYVIVRVFELKKERSGDSKAA